MLTSTAANFDGYTWHSKLLGGYTGGTGFFSTDQGTTWTPDTFDALFRIYGQP